MTSRASSRFSVAALTSSSVLPRNRGCSHLKRHAASCSPDFNPSKSAAACPSYSSRAALKGSGLSSVMRSTSREGELARRISLLERSHSAVLGQEFKRDVRELLDAKAPRLPRNEILKGPAGVLNRERPIRPQHDIELASARRDVGPQVLAESRGT